MISKILLVIALLLFIAATFGVGAPFNLIAAGLAFWVGSALAASLP